MLKLKRLLPSDNLSWVFWPDFEKRVVGFLDQYGSNMDAGQRQMFVTDLRQRFAATPQLSGYWLILNGKDALDQQTVGHICSWIDVRYGKPYVMIFQVEIDVRWEGRETLLMAVEETREWISDLNRQLAAKNERLIDSMELYTIKAGRAWKRWLPELEWVKEMTVMRISLSNQTSANHLVQ